ncbi:hypothetical protein [Halorubrum tibetense]|uniref:Uncharacterized protein n=1 Tax=Halorubrum tibetense TaxID=175631 RepID=A0ABD5SH41_9EURY
MGRLTAITVQFAIVGIAGASLAELTGVPDRTGDLSAGEAE